MEILRNFEFISKKDVSIAGGKGASLGEMIQAGISVPPGFVILSNAFEKFLEETDLNVEIEAILDSVNHKEMHTVENASEKIQALILQSEMPKDIATEIQKFFKILGEKYVAVRSSATAEDSSSAAWAGQLDSYLNTTEENLLENVKKCWASLFTPRAIFYRFEKNLHKQKISVAVVVQKMVESEKSGIAFSVHPVTEDRNQLIIEAGFGLGEAIVSGSVTPNSYVVEKNPRRIVDININTQIRALYRAHSGIGNEWKDISEPKASSQVLTEKQILELSELILRIENHYGFPCDIEWAYETERFYITQSRPITTLNPTMSLNNRSDSAEHIVQWHYWGCWKNTVLWASPWFFFTESDIYNILGLHDLKVIGDSVFFDGHFLTRADDFLRVKEKVIQSVEGASDWIKNYFSHCHRETENFSRLETEKNLVTFLQKLREQFSCSLLTRYIDYNLEPYAREKAAQFDMPYDRLLEYMQPDKLSLSGEYFAGLKNVTEETAEDYAKKFTWFGVDFYTGTPTITKEKVLLDAKRPAPIYAHQSLDDLPEELRRIASIGREISYLRTHFAELFNKVSYPYYSDLIVLGQLHHLNLQEILCLSYKEAIELSEKGVIPTDIKDRLERFGFEVKNGVCKILTGKDVQKLSDQFRPYFDPVEVTEEIKGTIGNRGKVIGRVRIVMEAREIYKVQHGEIIVAPETTPDYVPAMHRAIAFVTNQGGITSHAAIVAREMKKPCIIGTKIATQVLKDGDMVEVDANRGIVRIIENKPTTTLKKEKDTNAHEENTGSGYERVFGGPNMPFLVSDFAAEKYVYRYGFVITKIDNIWTCYMPLKEKRRTLAEGKKLFSKAATYKKYKSEYLKFIVGYPQQFSLIITDKDLITAKDFKHFIDLCWVAETYYENTQYFFTDLVVADKGFEQDFSNLKIRGRALLNDQYFSVNNYLEQVLKKVSVATGIDLANLYFYKWKEIVDLLNGKKVDIPDRVERLTFITHVDGNEKITLTGESARKKIIIFQNAHEKQLSDLSGTVANRGKVVGSVRILDQGYEHKNLSKFLDDMHKGEILVAETTSPEIMVACQKAAAIVTNQGGLMSHAAIVSRELEIPCIVGVEGATTKLKNGDMVEVDADNGVVKLLSRGG